MTIYEVRNQKEFDDANEKAIQYDEIHILETSDSLNVFKTICRVVLWDSSHAELWDSSHAELRDSSHAELRDSSHAELRDSSHAVLRDSSHAVLRDSSHAELWDSSHAELWDSSHAELRGSSHAELRDSSHAVLRDSSHAVLRDSSHAELRDSSHAVLRDSSHAVLRGSSHAELRGYTVAIIRAITAKVKAISPNAHAIKSIYKSPKDTKAWLSAEGITVKRNIAIVFKRVSKDFKTQENTKNETAWKIGTTVELNDYKPTVAECGEDKLHGCSKPYFCDEFRTADGDRYIAIAVAVLDMHFWGTTAQYPHKVSFRTGKVLYECDRYGEKING